MDEIVGPLVRGRGAAVAGAHILEKLDAGPARRCAQARDPEPRAGNVVQPFLLRAVVETVTGDSQPQEIAVEAQALVSVAYDDRGVV